VERQTELLCDRTKYLGDQTDVFRRTLRKESQKREEAVIELAEVRNSMQQNLNLELEAFRSVAEDKLQGLVDTESTIKCLEKRVQKDAEKEMRQALSYATHRTEEDEKWRFKVHEDLKEELHQMSTVFNEKIEESATKVEEQVASMRRRMNTYIDDQHKVNKSTTAQGLEIQQALKLETTERESEISALEKIVQELRHEQKTFEAKIDERIRAWEQQGADLHASTLARVSEVRVELLSTLTNVEEKFRGDLDGMAEANKELKLQFREAITSVRADLENEKGELDILSAMVEHNKLIVQNEIDTLHKTLEREVQVLQDAHNESLHKMKLEHDEKFKCVETELEDQKALQKHHLQEVSEQLAEIRFTLETQENEIRVARTEAMKENALLQKSVDSLRQTMQLENQKKQEAISVLREQAHKQCVLTSEQFGTAEGVQLSMQTRLDNFEAYLQQEAEQRSTEIAKLERHFENTSCKEAAFLDFKRNVMSQEKKHEAQLEDTLRNFMVLREEMEVALSRVDDVRRVSIQQEENWLEHKAECELKERILQTLKVDFSALENKLAQSPLLERILRPVAGVSPLSRSSPNPGTPKTKGTAKQHPEGPRKSQVGDAAEKLKSSRLSNASTRYRAPSSGVGSTF